MGAYNDFRSSRAADLRKLAVALRASTLACDVTPFDRAAVACEHHPPPKAENYHLPSEVELWGYTLSGARFTAPDKQRHVRPKNAEVTALLLSVDVVGHCIIEEDDREKDPFCKLGVGITLVGETKGSTGARLKSTWYMDRHSTGDTIKLPVHPTYHFQFGGLKAKNTDPGEMVLAATPRVAHPPMDAILAVDFILSNYFTSHWMQLRTKHNEYRQIVRDSQRLFWKPYAKASNHGWDRREENSPWQVADVWPQLIPDEGLGGLHQ